MFSEWLAYFRRNRAERMEIPWTERIELPPNLRDTLAGSLQRFQLGESGDGAHLKQMAATLRDPDYAAAIDLFVAEEQEHAALMARALGALSMPLLHDHWSNGAFRLFCLVPSLHLELMVLVVTEVMAKRYFALVRDATADPALQLMCRQILRDEEAHVAFHCATLRPALSKTPGAMGAPIRFIWQLFFELVMRVVSHDHGGLLRAAGIAPRQFRHDARRIFRRAMGAAFGYYRATKSLSTWSGGEAQL